MTSPKKITEDLDEIIAHMRDQSRGYQWTLESLQALRDRLGEEEIVDMRTEQWASDTAHHVIECKEVDDE